MPKKNDNIDLNGQWQLSAYTLQGIDPYPLIGEEIVPIESIGDIPKGWGTTPWGLATGYLLYLGVLPYGIVQAIYTKISICVLLYTLFLLYQRFKKTSKTFARYATLCAIMPLWFPISVYQGNCGGIISCLLFLIILYYKTNPIVCGILLGITMTKPQNALVFLFMFILLKQYKVVLSALSTISIQFLYVCIQLKKSPFLLLQEFLINNTGKGEAHYGLFTCIFPFNKYYAMITSMIFILLFIAYCKRKMAGKIPETLLFFPVCVGAVCCGYSFTNDFYILTGFPIACIYFTLYAKDKKFAFLSTIIAIYTIVGFNFYYFIVKKYIFLSRTTYEIGLILCCLYLCYKLSKGNSLISPKESLIP